MQDGNSAPAYNLNKAREENNSSSSEETGSYSFYRPDFEKAQRRDRS